MTQNIREEFYNKQQSVFEETGEFMSDEQIVDFFLSHHNTTLTEIEEEVEKKKFTTYDQAEIEEFEVVALDDIKQLIHQKLIK